MTVPLNTPKLATSDLKLEAVVIPVADVDRAKHVRPGLRPHEDL
jgi:hypothetical protein